MTPLPCPTCGVEDVPQIAAGTGPHWGKAVCAHCGRFLKWLPKPKEKCMQLSVNRCILLGAIGKGGVEVSYHGQGTAKAAFTLVVSELGSDGKEHQLWQPCEVWGKKAEAAGELDPGSWILIEGRLKRVKKGETWETIVSGFDCQPLRSAAPVPAAVGWPEERR
jgi:hypothetical protein